LKKENVSTTKTVAGGRDPLAIARHYIGQNPTGHRYLWCAHFMNFIERKAGRKGTGSGMARSYSRYGRGVKRAQVRPGDIAVIARGRRGGHVGYVVEPPRNGRVKLLSGNSGGRRGARTVRESYYPTNRVVAFRRVM